MKIEPKVREQLILSRQLLVEPERQVSTPDKPFCLARDLIIACGAAELALSAICFQCACLPDEKSLGLTDYFECLARSVQVHSSTVNKRREYLAELQKARNELQIRLRPPEAGRWARVKEETLEHLTGWCLEFLGMSLLDIEDIAQDIETAATLIDMKTGLEPVCKAPANGAPSDGPVQPVRPRYICAGSAGIKLLHREQWEKGGIANLSVGGCFLISDSAPEIGDRVELILQVNKMSFRAAGNVVHTPSQAVAGEKKMQLAGMGVEFKQMSAGARERLEELVAELKIHKIVMRRRLEPMPAGRRPALRGSS